MQVSLFCLARGMNPNEEEQGTNVLIESKTPIIPDGMYMSSPAPEIEDFNAEIYLPRTESGRLLPPLEPLTIKRNHDSAL